MAQALYAHMNNKKIKIKKKGRKACILSLDSYENHICPLTLFIQIAMEKCFPNLHWCRSSGKERG
jgi:hypothetical protein